MRLLFTHGENLKGGFEKLIDDENMSEVIDSIGGDGVLAAMAIGIPIVAHGGFYGLVEDEYEVCDQCGNTGEIDTYEPVYPNEAPTALIGTRKCSCKLKTNHASYV